MQNLFEQGNVVNRAELLARLGKTDRTLRRWLAQGLPRRPDGLFDLRAVESWLEHRSAARPGSPAAPGDTDTTDWAVEAKRFLAMNRELEYRQKQGRVIEKAEYDAAIRQIEKDCRKCQANVRGGFLGLIDKLPPLLGDRPPRECHAILKEEIYHVLTMLANGHDFIAEPFQKEAVQHEKTD